MVLEGGVGCLFSTFSQGIWSTRDTSNRKGFPDFLHKQVIKGLGYVQGMCWNFVLNDPKNKKHTKYSPHKHLQGNHFQKKLLFQHLLLQVLRGVYRMSTESMVRDLPTRLGPFRVEWSGMILDKVVATHM